MIYLFNNNDSADSATNVFTV